jgi:hypothetical protein
MALVSLLYFLAVASSKVENPVSAFSLAFLFLLSEFSASSAPT